MWDFGSLFESAVTFFTPIVVGAATQAAYGAAVGAAVAAVTGQDVGRGALYGAAAGAVSGGVMGALNLGTNPLSSDFGDATSLEVGADPLGTPAGRAGFDVASPSGATSGISAPPQAATGGNGFLSSDSFGEIAGRTLGGAATGLLGGIAAEDAAEAKAKAAQEERDAVSRNFASTGKGLLTRDDLGFVDAQPQRQNVRDRFSPQGVGGADVFAGRFEWNPEAGKIERVVSVPVA